MNIAEAAHEVTCAVQAYLAKDEAGRPLIERSMQRPLLIMGPPGIGKTAICRQAAKDLHINFCSYSMTHHTRQSAIGLPFIDEATFDGTAYKVSRYTMSEIIAATHDAQEASGVREGILFLDEVNCVSETLAPAMLQFLQFKTFGIHELPLGWVVVAAANPREYNSSARDFDAATLDRLRIIEVTPDLGAWMAYATDSGVHPSVTSYLERRPEHFYVLKQDLDGIKMVTARGWDELSRAIDAHVATGLPVARSLVGQYLSDPDVVRDFSRHLELFLAHEDTYQAAEILAGHIPDEALARAAIAPIDERLDVVALLAHRVSGRATIARELERQVRADHRRLAQAAALTDEARTSHNERVERVGALAREALRSSDAAFAFVERAWSDDECLVLAARLTSDANLMHLAALFGSRALVDHAGTLLFSARAEALLSRL